MNIFDNPFYKLGVSAKSNRRQISDKAEEKIFLNENESKSINEARNILIIPEKRLAAEIRWFPGVSDKNISEIIDYFTNLNTGHAATCISTTNLGANALLNFAVYMFRFNNLKNLSDLTKYIVAISKCFKIIHTESTCTLINKDRLEAGFTMVKRPEVEREFNNYRLDIVKTLNETLSIISKEDYRKLVEELTRIYAGDTDLLIVSDLLDDYELNIMPELETLKQEIINSVDSIQDNLSEKFLDNLSSMLEKWQELSKPIISVLKTRGSESSNIYNLTGEIFAAIREHAINLNNKYDKPDESLKLMQILKKYLAGISERFTSIINQDISKLNEIIIAKREEAKRLEEWAKSIEYETEFGFFIFKKKLKISVEGITWNGVFTPLDSITGISWGGVKTNFTKYKIAIKSSNGSKVEINILQWNKDKFEKIINHIWRALSRCLITRILNILKNGSTLLIGSIKFNDDGVFLISESYNNITYDVKFFSWRESLQIRSSNGSFIIERLISSNKGTQTEIEGGKHHYQKKINTGTYEEKLFTLIEIMHSVAGIKRFSASASYINDMNTHILEFIIRQFMDARKNNPTINKLSDLLNILS